MKKQKKSTIAVTAQRKAQVRKATAVTQKAKPVAAKRVSGTSVSRATPVSRAKPASKPASPGKAEPKIASANAAVAPDLYSSIHALLHTMRVIEQHEEPLCSMQDELKRTGKLSAPHRRKLRQLVDELPADVYRHDLETLRQAVLA